MSEVACAYGLHFIYSRPYGGVFICWKVIFAEKQFLRNYFLNFYVFIYHQKNWSIKNTFWSIKNTFQSKKNLTWFLGKCFPFILDGKHFLKVVKNLEILYYLLIISNLVLKLLIVIYIYIYIYCFEYLFFNFIPQNLIFILTLVFIFIIIICFFLIIF